MFAAYVIIYPGISNCTKFEQEENVTMNNVQRHCTMVGLALSSSCYFMVLC